jgi:hypothetical protein
MPGAFRKPRRRVKKSPNKNDLKAAHERAHDELLEQSGQLGERYPGIQGLDISWQMKTTTGVLINEKSHRVRGGDSLFFDIPCEGGCAGGSFLLTEAVHGFLGRGEPKHQGSGICRAASYTNANNPCGTELFYKLKVA